MKKRFFKASALLICSMVMVYGCKKEDVDFSQTPSHTAASREGAPDPWTIGSQHNELLAYLVAQMSDVNSATHAAANAAAAQHMLSFATERYGYAITPAQSTAAVAFHDDCYSSQDFYSFSSIAMVQPHLNNLVNEGLMPASERQIILNMFAALESARTNGGATAASAAIAQARAQWEAQGFKAENQEGFVSAAAISTAEGSLAYWQNFPDVYQPPTGSGADALAAWVVADAIGAATGAASELYNQRNNAEIDWGGVGGQALIWGAGTSLCGAAGRIAKYFKW
jgi:hypothetical protein